MGLPWNAVNETPPANVALVLDLPRSPNGGRKLCCPFCGGRNLAPLKRAFYCYSGCAGQAYSNVDTAARVWNVAPPEACRRLAAALDMAYSSSEVPWEEAAAFGTQEVAAVLQLNKRAEPWLWDCPVCGSEGTLRSYRKRWRCQSTTCAHDTHRGWRAHVDLAAAVWRTTRVDACFRLTSALRRETAQAMPKTQRNAEPDDRPVISPRENAIEALRARPGAALPADLYRHLLAHMRLGERGRAELIRRRLDPGDAERFGFRSVELGEWRSRILPLMRAFADDELLAAGFPTLMRPGTAERSQTPWWPGYGRAALLVIPYFEGDALAGLRFRNLMDPVETRCPRYASPVDAQPSTPFNGGALESGAHTVHVIEGDLNAYTLLSDPYAEQASGQPGAGAWQDHWTTMIKDSTRYLVGWFDNDVAGRKGAAKVRNSIALARGFEWAYHRWRLMLVDHDISDLHVAGSLSRLLRVRPWTTQDLGALWADEIALFKPPTPGPRV